jgi:hypothetical protein
VTAGKFRHTAAQPGVKFSHPILPCFEISGIGQATGSN